MGKIKWGTTRYYTSFKDDEFMHTKVLKEKKIGINYKYLPTNFLVQFFQFLFYYLIAIPVLWLVGKIKYGINVKGRKNIKKIKGGAILIGNHTHPMDCMIASVFVARPKRNYIISNKDAVQVAFGKYFTKALGALPLPDEQKGLANLSNAVDTLVKRGRTVTIYPEACIWHYCTFLRPLPSASFHYAVKSNVPVVPFAVTYRYAKGKNYLKKKPKINVTILEPIYPNLQLSPKEAKNDLAEKATVALKAVIETDDNKAYYKYVKIEKEENNEKSANND